MKPPDRDASAHTNRGADRSPHRSLIEELRTPVAVITAYTQILQRRIRREPNLQPHDLLDHLSTVERAAQRLEATLRRAGDRER